jgi:inhibitor of cysteine peptidase
MRRKKMRKVRMLLAMFILVAAAVSGVSQAGLAVERQTRDANAAVVIATQKEFVTTKAGCPVSIVLESNTSTGYSWNAVSISDPSAVVFVNSVRNKETMTVVNGRCLHVGEKATTPVVGAAESETVTFRTLKRGTTTIILGYSRPWEAGAKPVATVTLTITAR